MKPRFQCVLTPWFLGSRALAALPMILRRRRTALLAAMKDRGPEDYEEFRAALGLLRALGKVRPATYGGGSQERGRVLSGS
jgi:hypothetical protein